MIGPVGRQGPAATLWQYCPQMTRRHCTHIKCTLTGKYEPILVNGAICLFTFIATYLVLSNVDELFDKEEFSAAPDDFWPDWFNSGVFVFRPSLHTYQAYLTTPL